MENSSNFLKVAERNFCAIAARSLAPDWKKQYETLIICSTESNDPNKRRMAQEQHNSGHALTFFTFTVNMIVEGTRGGNLRERWVKTMGHLLCLREFLDDKSPKKIVLVHQLYELLGYERPDNYKKWVSFLVHHWSVIEELARCYKFEDRFSQSVYEKVRHVHTGHKYFKTWWWQLKVKKVTRKSISMIRNLVKVG